MKRNILFLAAFWGGFGCGSKGADAPAVAGAEPGEPGARVIQGTPTPDEIDEEHGVFVASIGSDANAGTRLAPMGSLRAAIALAGESGKRVYVCQGRYEEAIEIVNGVSVAGGLDCSDPYIWTIGSVRSQIVSPTSPGLLARNIDKSTRFEGFEVTAPDGDEANRSSFALLADHASGLVVANSRLVAGKGRDGAAGQPGIQLVPKSSGAGAGGAPYKYSCSNAFCMQAGGGYVAPAGALGGTSTCAGAPGHDPTNGGGGGSGGVMFYENVMKVWIPYNHLPNEAPGQGENASGAAGSNGTDGASGSIGGFGADGYVPADGTVGTDGTPGAGGRGGNGNEPGRIGDLPGFNYNELWTGYGGSGGGAGGCPGLAGTAGEGGGASVAAILVESPMTFDGSELVASDGGSGGAGTLGSDASSGSPPGIAALAASTGFAGGNGGRAGISGSGAGGPSFGIASVGVLPHVNESKIIVGQGGAGVAKKSKTDITGPREIPASSAGRSEPQHVF